jgi:putative methionine-R-sulfoxide reductase with GAF domain
MEFLGTALEPGFAAAYYARGEELIGMAARALPGRQLPTIRPGEGLTGEAARQPRMVVVDAVPPDYPEIRSGTGSVTPRQQVLVPIRHQDTARGVLELALLTPSTDQQRQLLADVSERLAQALLVAEARHGYQLASA